MPKSKHVLFELHFLLNWIKAVRTNLNDVSKEFLPPFESTVFGIQALDVGLLSWVTLKPFQIGGFRFRLLRPQLTLEATDLTPCLSGTLSSPASSVS